MRQIIKSVNPGSIGEELGFEPGDSLLGIDGQVIEDVLDYYYYCEKETLTLQILTKDGEEVECVVEKDEDEDLGLVFEEEFMGHYRRCSNQCMFCFIDQMPKGMRESLYFKDDDSRLSFLNGNYITMTNMSEEDFVKIIRYQKNWSHYIGPGHGSRSESHDAEKPPRRQSDAPYEASEGGRYPDERPDCSLQGRE